MWVRVFVLKPNILAISIPMKEKNEKWINGCGRKV